jgi:hypothetical protein
MASLLSSSSSILFLGSCPLHLRFHWLSSNRKKWLPFFLVDCPFHFLEAAPSSLHFIGSSFPETKWLPFFLVHSPFYFLEAEPSNLYFIGSSLPKLKHTSLVCYSPILLGLITKIQELFICILRERGRASDPAPKRR